MSEEAGIERRTRFNWRLLFAVLIPGPMGGMVAALILSVTAYASLQVYTPELTDSSLRSYLGLEGVLAIGAFFGGTWGLVPMLLCGLPAHVLFMRYGPPRMWKYLVAGTSAGVLFGGWIGLGGFRWFETSVLEYLSSYLGAGACAGVVAGLVFWLIRRPDRDAVSASPKP